MWVISWGIFLVISYREHLDISEFTERFVYENNRKIWNFTAADRKILDSEPGFVQYSDVFIEKLHVQQRLLSSVSLKWKYPE